jgi:S1-C subfamily serine protease
MRHKVGSRVVAVTVTEFSKDRDNTGGGTGFLVKAPSGKTFIVTNRHVCDDSKDGSMWVTVDGMTQDRKLKILKKSDQADLCLMEPIPGIEGLDIGDTPAVGDDVIYIGHPRLQARTYVSGELVGTKIETVIRGQVGKEISEAECKASKDSYIADTYEIYLILRRLARDVTPTQSIESLFKTSNKVTVCYERGQAYVTTLDVYGGASGSPMVNVYGEVVGVIYAGEQGQWGYAVILAELKQLLKGR